MADDDISYEVASDLTTQEVTVDTTGQVIVTAHTGQARSVVIKNTSPTTDVLIGKDATAAHHLGPGDALMLSIWRGAIYAKAVSGTVTLSTCSEVL